MSRFTAGSIARAPLDFLGARHVHADRVIELVCVFARGRLAAPRDRGEHLVRNVARVPESGFGGPRRLLQVFDRHGHFP